MRIGKAMIGFGPVAACALSLGGWALVGRAMAAEKAFAGEDAAYIDWAWKNCNVASTDKQHGLADQARTKGGDGFQKAYEQSYFKIAAATGTPPDLRRTCESVKTWYGPGGTKITDLVRTEVAKADGPGTSVGSKVSTPSSDGGGKRGGGGGRRGG